MTVPPNAAPIDPAEVGRILIIQPRGLGDIVQSTVLVGNLAETFPGAIIDYVTQARMDDALAYVPGVRRVITYDRRSRLSHFRAMLEVRRTRYDLVIDLFSNPRTALMTFVSGAAYRAGKAARGRAYAYTIRRREPVPGVVQQVERNLDFLEQLGVATTHRRPVFGLSADDRRFADDIFAATFAPDEFVVGLLPCGNWPSRKCDPDIFAGIADAVLDRWAARLLIVWGPGELEKAEEIARLMRHDPIIAPATSIRQMGALLRRCLFIIANDSGPMHIGATLGVPTLSLHGPTDPRIQGPYGPMHERFRLEKLDCIGCGRHACPRGHECFRMMPVDTLLELVERLIAKNGLAVGRRSLTGKE